MATAAERLAALEAAIDAFVAGGCVEEYRTAGITITRTSLASQLRARDALRAEVARGRAHGIQAADLRGCG